MSGIVIYLLIASATIASPGPGVILSITNSLTFDRKRTAVGILGLSLGMFAVALVSATSVGLLIATSKMAFLFVQIVGAFYILYMGIKMLLKKSANFEVSDEILLDMRSSDGWRLFKQGVLTSVSNPKPILFFMAVFPQFIDANQAYLPQFLVLAILFCLLVVAIHACYAEAFLAASKRLWRAQDNMHLVTKSGGVILVLLSVLLVINALSDLLNG